jgi:hypothetical protein
MRAEVHIPSGADIREGLRAGARFLEVHIREVAHIREAVRNKAPHPPNICGHMGRGHPAHWLSASAVRSKAMKPQMRTYMKPPVPDAPAQPLVRYGIMSDVRLFCRVNFCKGN